MNYFSHFLSMFNFPFRWCSINDILVEAEKPKELFESLANYTGIYLRDPFSIDEYEIPKYLLLRAILSKHRNVITPSSESTNHSKFLHTLKIGKKIQSCFRNIARIPDTWIGGLGNPLCDEIKAVSKPLSSLKGYASLRKGNQGYTYDDLCGKASKKIPYLTQHYVEGEIFRAHVIDDLVVFHRIEYDLSQIDYRLSAKFKTEEVSASREVVRLMVSLSEMEGARFSGIDYIVDSDSMLNILEVNPMPGYHSFEKASMDGMYNISNALHRSLKS